MHLNIYLPMTGYLREWVTKQLGYPVVFPRGSYENALIARFISPLPAGYAPQPCRPGDIAVEVPCIYGKPPERYNYFGRRGVVALTEAINNLFVLDLWHGVAAHITSANMNKEIDAWCESRGISIEFRESVRQKFYRIRRRYAERGVLLGKQYEKSILREKLQKNSEENE